MKSLIRKYEPYFYIAPFFILYCIFTLYPIIGDIIISFQGGTFTRLKFVGLQNYQRLFSDKVLLQTIINTFLFVIVSVVLYLFFALLFALWGQHQNRISSMIRICIYIPTILIISVMANIWTLLFRPEIGVWSYIFRGTSLAYWNWLRDVNLARWTIVLSTLWWTVGTNMLIIISALRSIPKELYEASSLDGAGEIKQFFSITLPHLYSVFKVLIILQTLASFKLFGQSMLITGGAPGHSTRSIVLYIYDVGFGARNPGYAAAISVLLMFILIIFSLIQAEFLKEK